MRRKHGISVLFVLIWCYAVFVAYVSIFKRGRGKVVDVRRAIVSLHRTRPPAVSSHVRVWDDWSSDNSLKNDHIITTFGATDTSQMHDKTQVISPIDLFSTCRFISRSGHLHFLWTMFERKVLSLHLYCMVLFFVKLLRV